MLSKTYDALKEAGAPDEKARAAAEEIANLHSRLLRLEVMAGINITLSVAIALKLFTD